MIFLPLLLQTLSGQPPATADRTVIDVAGVVREQGAQSITEVLASRVAGLLVIPGSGLTGAGSQIRFAARHTVLGNAAPLVVLDGIRIDATEDATALPVDGPGPLRLDDINIEDVESIEVLRAPTSVALFGPGAAAGVILIQMKRATAGPLRWETYGRATVSSPSGRWPTNYGAVDTIPIRRCVVATVPLPIKPPVSVFRTTRSPSIRSQPAARLRHRSTVAPASARVVAGRGGRSEFREISMATAARMPCRFCP